MQRYSIIEAGGLIQHHTGDIVLYSDAIKKIEKRDKALEQYRRWTNDLQSGMYINCVYCGHRYGPRKNTPVAMADVLKKHIEKCPEHPLSAAKKEIAELKTEVERLRGAFREQLRIEPPFYTWTGHDLRLLEIAKAALKEVADESQ